MTLRASRRMLAAAALAAGLIGLGPSAGAASAADWPQWRGPQRDGRSPDTGLLKKWPEGGPRLVWTATGAGEGRRAIQWSLEPPPPPARLEEKITRRKRRNDVKTGRLSLARDEC